MGWRTRHAALVIGPWLVFAGTVAVVAWLFLDRGRTGAAMGFAEAVTTLIGPLETGKLIAVSVQPGQTVLEGEVVAQLDPGGIDAEIAVIRADKLRILAEVEAERSSTERDMRMDLRDMTSELDHLRLELQREQTELGQAQAELAGLRAERKRIEGLVSQRLATTEAFADIDVQMALVKKQVAELPRVIALLTNQVHEAEARLDAMTSADPGPSGSPSPPRDGGGEALNAAMTTATAPLLEEIAVLDRQIELLEQRRRGTTLRAPVSGRVTAIFRRPGEIVQPAEPVVGLVETASERVMACLPEQLALVVQLGERVRVRDRNGARGGGGNTWASVVSLGPLVDQLPTRCWRTADVPLWGRTALLKLDHMRPIVPGQAFDLAFMGEIDASGSAVAQSHATSSEADSHGEPLLVPRALRERSRLEPSGALWDAAHDRYLVASDDTGTPEENEHAPWLFSVSRDGGFAPEPLVIQGLEKVNDLESLAWGPAGHLYALSSQSKSKRGKRPLARTAFLRIAPSAGELRFVERVSLFAALEALDEEGLAALGLDKGGLDALDIEGMTPWQGGLLLGLKSPQDSAGRSLLWHMASPDALLAGRGAKEAGLSLWGRVAVGARADGVDVMGGISDLLALPDGRILASSTPASGDPDVPTGAIWVLERSASGDVAAKHVRWFVGQKPEALAPSPKSGVFVVFFDRGAEVPTWAELPWPR